MDGKKYNPMLNQILFQIILFATNIIQTVTGFAGAMLAMPFAIQLVGLEEGKAIVNIATMETCIFVVGKGRSNINKQLFLKMTAFMLIGVAIGNWAVVNIPLHGMYIIYSLLITAVGIKKLFFNKQIWNLPSWMSPLILIGAGFIHGAFLSGGALLIIFAVGALKNKEEFRTTVSAVWIVLNSILLVIHVRDGYFNKITRVLSVVSMLLIPCSIWIGNKTNTKINQKIFMYSIYFLILIAGISLLINI